MTRARRPRSPAALDALAVELVAARADLASSMRTRAALERLVDGADPGRCDAATPASICAGAVRERWCELCGATFRVCRAHGDLRSATHRLDVHKRQAHGGQGA